MAKPRKKPPPRTVGPARHEYVDTATGEPVEPAPNEARPDGAAPSGRLVADVDGVRVTVEDRDVLGRLGRAAHPREATYDHDPFVAEERAAELAAAPRQRDEKARKPRSIRATFDTPAAAAKAFYDENEAFFDHVRDPHDGVRDWLDGMGTPPRDRERILALRGAPQVRAALTLVFGRARGRRWDAVTWRDVEGLAAALEQFWEDPGPGEASQPAVYWWPVVGTATVDQLERMAPDERIEVAAWEASEEIRGALADLREAYERRKACMTPNARHVVERRIGEWQRWANNPRRIPAYACSPDERTGGNTCDYPSIAAELRRLRSACDDEGYDPDWSTELSRAAAEGYPDTSKGPPDPLPHETTRSTVPPDCMTATQGRAFGGPKIGIVEQRMIDGVLYQYEYVRCGNSPKRTRREGARGCKCYRDFPNNAHGPRWFAFFIDSTGRRRSKYLGNDFRELTRMERA